MPTNKGALIRRQVLDSCLSQNREFTLLQLMEKCNEKLREHGFKLVSSENTIRSDLNDLQSQYPQAEVIWRRSGRNILYRYKEKNFSIYKLPLTNEEILELTQAISVFSRFDGVPGYDWLDSIIERFKPYISIDTSVKNFVGFDDNFDLKGYVIMTRKVLMEMDNILNELNKERLSKQIGTDVVIVPSDPEDPFCHTDGLVRYVCPNTVLLRAAQDETDKKYLDSVEYYKKNTTAQCACPKASVTLCSRNQL